MSVTSNLVKDVHVDKHSNNYVSKYIFRKLYLLEERYGNWIGGREQKSFFYFRH